MTSSLAAMIMPWGTKCVLVWYTPPAIAVGERGRGIHTPPAIAVGERGRGIHTLCTQGDTILVICPLAYLYQRTFGVVIFHTQYSTSTAVPRYDMVWYGMVWYEGT